MKCSCGDPLLGRASAFRLSASTSSLAACTSRIGLIGSQGLEVEFITWVRRPATERGAPPVVPVFLLALVEGDERRLADWLDGDWLPVDVVD
jgi:hypothetical protein